MHFDGHGMMRHLSFNSIGELIATLVMEVPSDVYCSNALYRFPRLQMHEKQWFGADLIFDIDGKDLDLSCIPSHSYPICGNCGHLSTPDKKEYACPSCGGKKASYTSIPCNKCVDASKKEAISLISFLTEDLGIGKENIHLYFSGNNGFHFHIKDSSYIPLDSQARSDLVDHIMAKGLMPESMGVRKSPSSNLALVKAPKGGFYYSWRKKIANKLQINAASTIKLTNLVAEKGGYTGFKHEVEKIVQEMSVRIDPQVTMDVHRIFRMPGTLNSKSGLVKIRCNIDTLDSFDPFKDACLLGDKEITVNVKIPIKIKLKNRTFNLSNELQDLPSYAATYLICKGLAEAT
jgi:DNA primase small subunit